MGSEEASPWAESLATPLAVSASWEGEPQPRESNHDLSATWLCHQFSYMSLFHSISSPTHRPLCSWALKEFRDGDIQGQLVDVILSSPQEKSAPMQLRPAQRVLPPMANWSEKASSSHLPFFPPPHPTSSSPLVTEVRET